MRSIACAGAVTALFLFGCSKTETSAPQPTAPAMSTTAPEPSPPPKPMHHYALEEDGEYGYEKGISEDEKRAGTMTSALMMIRYLGEKDGTYTVAMVKSPGRSIYTCKAPCEFVKMKVIFNGQVIANDTARAPEGSLIWAIMSDAMSGQLTPYKAPKP